MSRRLGLLLLLLPLLACGGTSGGIGEPPATLPLHLLIPASDFDSRVLPVLLEPLDAAVAEFVQDTGREVVIDRLQAPDYERALGARLASAPHPDLLCCPATLLALLVEAEAVVPLQDRINQAPETLDGTQPWMQELYERDGHMYGVPVGEKGHHPLMGYTITAAATRRGHVRAAFDLLRHLRGRVPRRGLCDVALDELTVTVEDGGGGDVIEEIHYLDGLVRNLGDVGAENVHVVVEADELGHVAEFEIPWIESQGEETFRVELGAPDPGFYFLRTIVSQGGALGELNETNNVDQVGWFYKYNSGGTGPSVVKPLSGPIAIEPKAYITKVSGSNPKVASDGTNYLVVYAKQTPLSMTTYNHQLRGARVSSTGTVLDPGGFLIASKVTTYNNFAVAFGNSTYVVAWEEDAHNFGATDPASRIGAARVSTAGTVLDPTPIQVDAGKGSSESVMRHEYPSVYWDGSHFVVIYRDLPYSHSFPATASPYGIFAKRISSAGQVQSGKPRLLVCDDAFATSYEQHVAWAAGEGLVIVEGLKPKSRGIYGLHFKSSGGDPVPSSTPLVTFTSTANLQTWLSWPCVALTSKSHYMGVWSRHVSTGTGKFYRTDLATVGGPGSVATQRGPIATKAGDQFPAIAHGGNAYTIVTQHAVGCHAYVGAVRVNQSGTWSAPVVLAGPNLVEDVDIAFAATNGLIAFENLKPPTSFNGPDRYYGVYVRLIDKSK